MDKETLERIREVLVPEGLTHTGFDAEQTRQHRINELKKLLKSRNLATKPRTAK